METVPKKDWFLDNKLNSTRVSIGRHLWSVLEDGCVNDANVNFFRDFFIV